MAVEKRKVFGEEFEAHALSLGSPSPCKLINTPTLYHNQQTQPQGSATLSMAYAAALFADACLRGLNGDSNVVECAYVQSEIVPGLPYFASKVKLGTEGVEEIYGLGDLNAYERECLEAMKPELLSSINKGIEFAKAS